MLKEFVLQQVKKYPGGLSRGMDNDYKLDTFGKFRDMLKGVNCITSVKVLDLFKVDHYDIFYTDEYLYVYSQPYGGRHYPNFKPREIEEWELIEYLDTSWYYPEHCATFLYRRPLSKLIGYRSKADGWVIWVTQEEELDSGERRFKGVTLLEVKPS